MTETPISGLSPWEADLLAQLAAADAHRFGVSTVEAMARRALALRLQAVADQSASGRLAACRFHRADDGTWLVRGPFESLRGRGVVTVLQRNGDEVEVYVDPDSLTPLPSDKRTRWDGRLPHTVRVLPDVDAFDPSET